MSDEDLNLDERRLCPDGACIGVIGANGRCRVCGRRAEPGNETLDEVETEADTEAKADAETEAEPAADADAAFEDDRRLCPDGACIGVIGDDGRCKVCGTPSGS